MVADIKSVSPLSLKDNEMPQFLAFDLGAESGRAVLGTLSEGRLSLRELHRFPNGPVPVSGTLYWDVFRLWGEVLQGLRLAADADLAGVGLDAWGVDFGLLDESGALLGNPVHYRDARTDGMMERAFEKVPRREIFERTGIQFMQLNTLYQLYSMVVSGAPVLRHAASLLTMPDLLNYWLSGRTASEFTIATTTQCYDPRAKGWATDVLAALDIPTHIFQEVVPPGTVLGVLRANVPGLEGRVLVIAPACHDTGSAVAAVPADYSPATLGGDEFACISSGTWSVMGAEVREPIITEQSLGYNFTNEGGVAGTFRLLKNITGLWLVQECRRVWAEAGAEYSYDELTALAQASTPYGPLVDPNSADFLHPGDMPARIAAFCARTGQPVPTEKGAIVRCALESLGLKYRQTLEHLEALLGHKLEVIHIVGGGSRNELLCQLTAGATGLPVIAGPVEATAIGNVMVQAMATGHLTSLEEGRAMVRRSFALKRYEPAPSDAWDGAYARFLDILET
jgi:rhamnulokinase